MKSVGANTLNQCMLATGKHSYQKIRCALQHARQQIPISRGVCVLRKHLVGNDLRVVPCHLSYIFRNGT